MQRITLDSEISYVVTEKELKEIRADEREKVLKAVIDSGWHCEVHSDKALYEMVDKQLKEDEQK